LAGVPFGEVHEARGAAGGFRRVEGRLLPEEQMQKSKALLSAPLGVSAPGSAQEEFQRRTAGAREAHCRGRLPAAPYSARESGAAAEQQMRPIEGRICVREQNANAR
jgi:hypothetical protein